MKKLIAYCYRPSSNVVCLPYLGVYYDIYIFINPSARAECDMRSIFFAKFYKAFFLLDIDIPRLKSPVVYHLHISPMVRETGVQSQFESYQSLKKKWYLIPPCLTLSIIRYVSRVKWSNPGKGVAPSPTPRCSSY